MSIILKLVGNNTYNYAMVCSDYQISLEWVQAHLIMKGIPENSLGKIKVINNGSIMEPNIVHLLHNTNEPIYIYTQDTSIRNILIECIFSEKNNIVQPELEQSVEPELEQSVEPEVISINTIDQLNESIMKQFEDPDFTNLLRIISTKPHLLDQASSYLMNGSISETIHVSTEEFKYNEQYLILEELGFVRMDPSDIKSIVTHFKGHLNLCIRYILWQEALLTLISPNFV